ncbi:helix-turn-helix domain-containing protein [Phenylobacterium sp.]|uniref:AraC family transcriptional regulator n=1 Tax=Phenylobacterium sp. TaxID=1871053 RepID=UPI003D2B5003
MLVFGWRTAVLALVSVQVLLLAVALASTPRNQPANRCLAALIVVLVGMLTPYTIGFAGFYDAWPWLTFAPFAAPLAVGPLAFAYVRAWTDQPLRPSLAIHLAPAAAQFAYSAVCFALPPAQKFAWADGPDTVIAPVLAAAAPVSLSVYALASAASLRRYRARLGDVVTDEARFTLGWLTRALIALTITLAAWAGFQLWEIGLGRLSYFQRLGLYLVIAALALYLAIEGWRHASLRRPILSPAEPLAQRAPRDWRETAQAWAARIEAAGWWREPDLTLADLAARLGANTHYVSRALNEGLGQNFAAFINGLRARAVHDALAAGDRRPLLDLAFEAGFNSKASFNRAYLAAYGEAPSAARRRGSEPKFASETPEVRRDPA